MSSEPSVSCQMKELKLQLNDMQQQIDCMNDQLTQILNIVTTTQTACHNMDEHIEFVESVYTTVRHPLEYVSSKFFGGNHALPCPKSNNNNL